MKVKSLVVSGLFLLAAAMALAMLSRRTLEDHECYVSVTAREMLQNDNWVLPTLNGRTRINKTPLSYWLVAYKWVSEKHVQYFGKTIPVVEDPNEFYKHYERGDWIICRSNYLDELNGRQQLHEVCSQNKSSEEKKSGPGVSLYHQTAPGLPRAGAVE